MQFSVVNDDSFNRLAAAYAALRDVKASGAWPDEVDWLVYFDDEAIGRFWWPTVAERDEHWRRYQATPVPDRDTDPALKTPWDFESMLDAFRDGEYELLKCERMDAETGRLTFDPHAWPYGGCGCMKALIEAFGHTVTAEPVV